MKWGALLAGMGNMSQCVGTACALHKHLARGSIYPKNQQHSAFLSLLEVNHFELSPMLSSGI
jgi:hypothetical protein